MDLALAILGALCVALSIYAKFAYLCRHHDVGREPVLASVPAADRHRTQSPG